VSKEQKQVLRSIAVLVGAKALIYASIYYSAKHYREAMARVGG